MRASLAGIDTDKMRSKFQHSEQIATEISGAVFVAENLCNSCK